MSNRFITMIIMKSILNNAQSKNDNTLIGKSIFHEKVATRFLGNLNSNKIKNHIHHCEWF